MWVCRLQVRRGGDCCSWNGWGFDMLLGGLWDGLFVRVGVICYPLDRDGSRL